jgi:phenylpyruvate tautomerase PptA (4-oxalocrotonate tautomerase family)
MPLVQIDVQQGHSTAHRRAILDSVHAALVECFKIPDHDRHQVLREHAAENFDRPPGKSDNVTVVQLFAFAGRSREAKRDLFAAIVRNLQRAPGIDPLDVFIVLCEPPRDNWGIRGGQQASGLDLGFKIDV